MRFKFSLRNNSKTNITAWLGAVIICFQYVCATIAIPRISIVLASIIIIITAYQLVNHRFIMTARYMTVVAYITVAFLLSFIAISNSTYTLDYLERFILYGLAALLVGFQVSETAGVIKRVIIIGVLGLPFLLLSNVLAMNTSNRMGYAYACLPILVASFLGLEYEKIFKVICGINIVVILAKFAAFAPRGVWIVIATTIVFIVYWKLCVKNGKGTKLITSIIILAFLFGGAIYVFSNLEMVVTAINSFLLSKFNVKIYALDKYLRYLAQDKLYNGRDYLWALAKTTIYESPIVGHGIGYFETLSSGSYCHNIILQGFCEAGVFFGVPLIIYIGRQVSKVLRSPFSENIESFKWLILIFCVGIEMLLFSSVYWYYSLFWFFLGSCLSKKKVPEGQEIQ